jgi:hypothetical protein
LEIDGKISRAEELIAKREEIDAELNELLGGSTREKRSPKYSICGEPGHRASTCPSKPIETVQVVQSRFGGLFSCDNRADD